MSTIFDLNEHDFEGQGDFGLTTDTYLGPFVRRLRLRQGNRTLTAFVAILDWSYEEGPEEEEQQQHQTGLRLVTEEGRA